LRAARLIGAEEAVGRRAEKGLEIRNRAEPPDFVRIKAACRPVAFRSGARVDVDAAQGRALM